jgi:hypothetical protein
MWGVLGKPKFELSASRSSSKINAAKFMFVRMWQPEIVDLKSSARNLLFLGGNEYTSYLL